MQTSERSPSTTSQLSTETSKKPTAKTVDGVTGEIIDQGGVDAGSKISSERAFADYVFGSLILHGFCVNFIN
jgi:oligosaccharyltransferase complex subunit epsilon